MFVLKESLARVSKGTDRPNIAFFTVKLEWKGLSMLPEFWFSFGYPYYTAFSSCLARDYKLNQKSSSRYL